MPLPQGVSITSDSAASELDGLGEPIERPPGHRLEYDDHIVEAEQLVGVERKCKLVDGSCKGDVIAGASLFATQSDPKTVAFAEMTMPNS